jgi:hypothetical protein
LRSGTQGLRNRLVQELGMQSANGLALRTPGSQALLRRSIVFHALLQSGSFGCADFAVQQGVQVSV